MLKLSEVVERFRSAEASGQSRAEALDGALDVVSDVLKSISYDQCEEPARVARRAHDALDFIWRTHGRDSLEAFSNESTTRYATDRIARWVERSYGYLVMSDLKERALRLMEEACELAQAHGVDREMALRLVERVWARDPGEGREEVRDVAVCLSAYAHASGLRVDSLIVEGAHYLERLDPERIKRSWASKLADYVVSEAVRP